PLGRGTVVAQPALSLLGRVPAVSGLADGWVGRSPARRRDLRLDPGDDGAVAGAAVAPRLARQPAARPALRSRPRALYRHPFLDSDALRAGGRDDRPLGAALGNVRFLADLPAPGDPPAPQSRHAGARGGALAAGVRAGEVWAGRR